MIWLALRLSLHNRTRLAVTLVGVIFSSYLTLTEVALYIGMMENATAVIRHASADLWVTSKGIRNFDFAKPFPEDRVKQVLALRDVLWARPIMLTWGFLKLASGAQEQVEIVGYDPLSLVGAPWEMAKGSARDVRGGPFIILDESSWRHVGDLRIGSSWELNDYPVRLVGISRSARTFTTAPIVFTSYSFSQEISSDVAWHNSTAFLAVKLRHPAESLRVANVLREELRDNDILSTNDFVKLTVFYWTAETGIGAALCLTALLGLIVGGGVIGQTIFANTMEHTGELATLKAIGAANADLDTIIFGQAVLDAVAGYSIAAVLAIFSKPVLEQTGVSLALSLPLIGGLLILILAISVSAAFLSVRRVRRLDPAMVFRS
jgi:putative ABC transport system permease protein